jgi:DNA-binding CsgD family transcriptional regulator
LLSATNALNAVQKPAIAINRFGYVLDANSASESVFDDEICVRGGKLFVADSRARGCLAELMDRVRITPDTKFLEPVEPIVVRRKTKAPVIIRILPVHGAARTPFLGARALLTFVVIEPKPGPTVALLARAFGLTPAEARLASIVAEGIGLEHAAKELGIARETARNQLKAVFAKTGTHRQGELVALLSRL